MTILKKIFSRKETPSIQPKVCIHCDNFYLQYIVKPDMTDLKGNPIPKMVAMNYCTVHNVSLPVKFNKQGLAEVDILNCKQFEPLK